MKEELEQIDKKLAGKGPEAIVGWAWNTFRQDLAMSSSFQMQSLPLLHIVSRVAPDLPILFVDTGFHFVETIVFRDQIVEEWDLNLLIVEPGDHAYPRDLHRTDPDLCCRLNKVEPFRASSEQYGAWITGIRRDQTPARADIALVEEREDQVRIHPMAAWTGRDIWEYIHDHSLPRHPLLEKGYLSVGCAPCTVPSGSGERSGRWPGSSKTECGLHTDLRDSRSA